MSDRPDFTARALDLADVILAIGAGIDTPQKNDAAVRDGADLVAAALAAAYQQGLDAGQAKRKCEHGHTVKQVGCVSCVMVFDWPPSLHRRGCPKHPLTPYHIPNDCTCPVPAPPARTEEPA